MKLFGRDRNKDKDNKEEKPIIFYIAKQIGVSDDSTWWSFADIEYSEEEGAIACNR